MRQFTRQQRRAVERELAGMAPSMREMLRGHATVRESGYNWPRRVWKHYEVWRRYGLKRWLALRCAVKAACIPVKS